jgi:hypothetical protein
MYLWAPRRANHSQLPTGVAQRRCLSAGRVSEQSADRFYQPVNRVVGEAILALEQARPAQLAALDAKTGELVHFLFFYRGQRIGYYYCRFHRLPLRAGVHSALRSLLIFMLPCE